MKKILALLLILAFLLGCTPVNSNINSETTATIEPSVSATIDAGTVTPADDLSVQEQLDNFFSNYSSSFSGSFLIAKGDEILYCKGTGMADDENGIAFTSTTVCPIASLTKQFTAMGIMQLYEKGLLDIEDPLSKYLPDFPRGDEITLKHLLTQSSGIETWVDQYTDESEFLPMDEVSVANIIKMIEGKYIHFEPGSKFGYSNTNYLILGYILEQVSGLRYAQYMQKNIFDPVGMQNTGVAYADGQQTFSAVGYIQTSDTERTPVTDLPAFEYCLKGFGGDGCICSTVEDLFLWDQALKTELLLSKEYMDMIFTPSVTIAEEVSYGFGWYLQPAESEYGTVYVHNGAFPGFSSQNAILVDKDITAIFIMNLDCTSTIPAILIDDILDIIEGE